jgi:hypothetical protein
MVVLNVKPGSRLHDSGKLTLNFPEPAETTTVTLSNIFEKDQAGNEIPVGLTLDVKVKAENIDEAIKKAKGIADGVTSFASLCSGFGMPIVREELAYDITVGVSDRSLLQFFHEVPVRPSRREIDHLAMIDIIQKTINLSDSDQKDRVIRAIRWYRRGSLAIDVLEKFTWFWIGLEALNPLLQKIFDISDTPTVSGIKAAVQKFLPNGIIIYPRMRDLRVGLIHGKSELKTLIPEAVALHNETREVLVRAILMVLDVSPTEKFLRDTLSADSPLVAAVVATLHGSDPSNLGPPSQHPHFELKSHEIKKTEVTSKGVTMTISTNLVACLGTGVTITASGWRVYGQETTLGNVDVKKGEKSS